jgi:hypothetical protein
MASELSVHGLAIGTAWGIGAPLNAATRLNGGTDPARTVFPKVRVPVTCCCGRPGGQLAGGGTIRRGSAVDGRQTVDRDGWYHRYEPTSALAQAPPVGRQLRLPGSRR